MSTGELEPESLEAPSEPTEAISETEASQSQSDTTIDTVQTVADEGEPAKDNDPQDMTQEVNNPG